MLCDNDLDRDHECFTDAALEKLAVLFRGKTGIFDHDPAGKSRPPASTAARWRKNPVA
ncbi:MAG: hypothetical protein ACLUNX_03185 [Angelakisella sp.]